MKVDALLRLLDEAPARDENEGCAHHYGNLTYPCSCTVPVTEVRAALASQPAAESQRDALERNRLAEALHAANAGGHIEALLETDDCQEAADDVLLAYAALASPEEEKA